MRLLEPVEGLVERTQGMTEDAVRGVVLRSGLLRTDGMRAFVVSDCDRAARFITVPGCVRRCHNTCAQAGEQQKYDTGTLHPRRTAEHPLELSEGRAGGQALPA